VRWLPGIEADRAELRTTFSYAFTPRFAAGAEWNPLGDDVRPIATWRVFDETESLPALILGTSSDRIGTQSGSAYTAVLAKDLEAWTGLPVAPYAGAYYGTQEHAWDEVAGLMVRWDEDWSTYHMWDGRNLHHMLEHWIDGGHTLGLVVAELDGRYSAGLSWSWNFAAPWSSAHGDD
jgi:hypothetical protein